MFTPEQEGLLIRSYETQALSVDALGGTYELRQITRTFNTWTRSAIGEDAVLSALISLRKRGLLRARTDRKAKEPAPPTWDRKTYVDGTNAVGTRVRYYEQPLPVHVDMHLIVHTISCMSVRPVLRSEVFDFLSQNVHTVLGSFGSTDSDDDDTEPYDDTARLAHQLFPELVV